MGFFKVDRQIFDHWLWEDKPFSKGQAWIDLIGLANYEDGKTPYQGKVITCKRGTIYRSISYLAERWGWSRDKTRSFLNLLESDGMVTIKATTHQTTITLVNYGKFQDKPATDSSTNRQQTDSKPYKERRRIKNNKKGERSADAQTPTNEPDPYATDDEGIRRYLEAEEAKGRWKVIDGNNGRNSAN